MPFNWKVTWSRKANVTTLQLFDQRGNEVASGSGKDIWEAREQVLATAPDVELQNYIAAHIFPATE